MLLRTLSQHIKDQNWFAVFIDFLIVVIGVFIGIQVANWNDARNAAANEVVIMKRLVEEMKVIETELVTDLAGYQDAVSGTGRVIDLLRIGEKPTDQASLKKSLKVANTFLEIPSLSATYSELVANGELRNITDHNLRKALYEYGDMYSRHQSMYSVARGHIFHPHSNYFRAVEWSSNPDDWRTTDNAIVSYDWELLLASKAEMQSWQAHQNDGKRLVEQMYTNVQEILSILEDR